MSWLFSRALVAEFSGPDSSGGVVSAPLSVMPTPQPFRHNDRTTDASTFSRFGPTCAVLTADRGEELLTWYRAGFRARTSVSPAKAPASTASAADFGGKWPESFVKWDRATSSWRTRQCSLFEGWDEFSGTWPRWGMMLAGECSALSMPAHLTSASESGSWPAPNLPQRPQDERSVLAGLMLQNLALEEGEIIQGAASLPRAFGSSLAKAAKIQLRMIVDCDQAREILVKAFFEAALIAEAKHVPTAIEENSAPVISA